MLAIVRTTRVKNDASLGLVLSVFFGVGLVLLTWLQSRPDAAQAGLDTYLFGQAAALVERDLVVMAVFGGGALLVALLFWKELKLLCFDPDFGSTLGLRMRALEVLVTALLVVAIVIGLQLVGVVLMSAMVVAPAAAARQWTDSLGVMTLVAAGIGAAGGAAGALVSAQAARMPTGPTIVLALTLLVVGSLLFAPHRGLVWTRLARATPCDPPPARSRAGRARRARARPRRRGAPAPGRGRRAGRRREPRAVAAGARAAGLGGGGRRAGLGADGRGRASGRGSAGRAT